MTSLHTFTDPSLAIIFAYAPAGLGHLRVTDALRHGIPSESQMVLLPTRGDSIRFMHQITSVNAPMRRLLEWSQRGRAEKIFTKAYRKILLHDAKYMEEQLYEILKQRVVLPKTVLVVASHFGIAHQVGAIKKKLEQRADVKVILVVQVTDDSPQSLWYVPGADLIVVPSEYTKEILLAYGKMARLPQVKFEVLPYPLSPHLGEKLSHAHHAAREKQHDPKKEDLIHVAVPISGAGVGMTFAKEIMQNLHKSSERFRFHLIAKHNPFTDMLVSQVERKEYIQKYTSHSSRQIIELYETVYTQNIIGFEITKPSEQAFKAMFYPNQIGGAILLFTTPVGRQEYDNLNFLRRHNLIPTQEEELLLNNFFTKEITLSPREQKLLFALAANWRGLRIPDNSATASKFIWWCHQNGLFAVMSQHRTTTQENDPFKHEVDDDGVQKFWKRVEELL